MQLLDCSEVMARLNRAGLLDYAVIDEESGVAVIRFKKPWDSETLRQRLERARKKWQEKLAQEGNIDLRIKEERASQGICPDCGRQLLQAEGCLTCRWCGYSKC